MKAVKENNLQLVSEVLAASNIGIEEADEQRFTPLIWAAREGYSAIVRVLLEKGANPNKLDKWMQANAGHKAAFWGRSEAMQLLVKNGLDVNARGGYNGYTALHDAVARAHIEVVKVLLAAGAKTDIAGHDGKTARDLAERGAGWISLRWNLKISNQPA